MSRISSIGTATNSNLAGIGPSLNITGGACMANASKTGSSAQEIKDGNADVKRHEVCLTASARNKSAYVPVISTDTVAVSPLYSKSSAYSKLPITEANPSTLDMTMATYYREVGDARCDLEYILRKSQISLHAFEAGIDEKLRTFQDNLLFDDSGGASMPTHRKNAIVFGVEADFTEDRSKSQHPWHNNSSWQQHPNDAVKGVKHLVHGNSSNCDTIDTEIYGISLENPDYMVLFKKLVAEISTRPVRVFGSKSTQSDPIEPPMLTYAGIALTDACLHAQNGDTAVTLNIFSALTVNNGPFDVYSNDDLMWIFSVELADFEKDGLRRFRDVLTFKILETCLLLPATVHSVVSYIPGQARRSRAIIVDSLKHRPGNPSRKTFLIAPLKRGFGLLKRSSIQDKMRHIGTAISSCSASKRLDMVNGAMAKF